MCYNWPIINCPNRIFFFWKLINLNKNVMWNGSRCKKKPMKEHLLCAMYECVHLKIYWFLSSFIRLQAPAFFHVIVFFFIGYTTVCRVWICWRSDNFDTKMLVLRGLSMKPKMSFSIFNDLFISKKIYLIVD